MGWIKIRKDLFHDPAVIAIAARLGLPELHVVGLLARVWAWADDVTALSRFGHVPSVTTLWIDRTVGVVGFADAMISVGWMSSDESGITFPNFDRHMSKTAKERCQAQLRKSWSRSCHADVTVKSRSCHAPTVTREDEMREDKKDATTVASSTDPAEEKKPKEPPAREREFIEAWNALGAPFDKIIRLGARQKLLAARWCDPWWRGNWSQALAEMAASRFCRGEVAPRKADEKPWVADAGWFLKPDSVTKIREGKYKNGNPVGGRVSEYNEPGKFDKYYKKKTETDEAPCTTTTA